MSDSMNAIRDGVRRLGLGAWVALFAVVLALLAPANPALRFVKSLFTPNPPAPSQPGDPKKNAEQRAAEFAAMLAQFDGRSLMRTPAPPATADATKPTEDPDKPPPPPTSYGGPPIIAMINGDVWFANGTILNSSDDAKDDLKVVKTNPPWDATVTWKGVEFKVELFARSQVVYKEAADTDTTPRVEAAPFDPAPEKPPPKKEEPKKDEPPPPPPRDGPGPSGNPSGTPGGGR
ncbi:MAG: hypothetical protein WC718_10765 [Phycisphaerales bacterium]|jgi:hypothetical protein